MKSKDSKQKLVMGKVDSSNLKPENTMVKPCVKVFVGYSWDCSSNCKKDIGWTRIRDYFKKTKESLEKQYEINISFRRLRASHGCFVWNSILSKIKSADILIFDVSDKNNSKQFNNNVLLELGATMALEDKKVLVMCHKEMLKIFPSDLSGLCLSLYSGTDKKFEDKWGLLPQFSRMVKDIVISNGWFGAPNDDEDMDECFCVANSINRWRR